MASARTNPPRGGVGTQGTPATNTGGGSGLGDSGYPKGSGPVCISFLSHYAELLHHAYRDMNLANSLIDYRPIQYTDQPKGHCKRQR